MGQLVLAVAHNCLKFDETIPEIHNVHLNAWAMVFFELTSIQTNECRQFDCNHYQHRFFLYGCFFVDYFK